MWPEGSWLEQLGFECWFEFFLFQFGDVDFVVAREGQWLAHVAALVFQLEGRIWG